MGGTDPESVRCRRGQGAGTAARPSATVHGPVGFDPAITATGAATHGRGGSGRRAANPNVFVARSIGNAAGAPGQSAGRGVGQPDAAALPGTHNLRTPAPHAP